MSYEQDTLFGKKVISTINYNEQEIEVVQRMAVLIEQNKLAIETGDNINNSVEAIFILNPNTKPRQTQSDKWKKRPCVVQYRAFADELRRQAAEQNYILNDTLHIMFFIPMPESWSKKKRNKMDGQPHKQTPDVDNLIKAVQDALLGQDKSIWKGSHEKRWSTEGKIIIYKLPIPQKY